MTKEALHKAIQREPFHPFVLHLADGREIAAPHRDFVTIHPTGRTAVVFGDDEDLEILDGMLITNLRMSKKAARNKGAGPS